MGPGLTRRQLGEIRMLQKKASARREQGLFVVEGLRMVREAPKDDVVKRVLSESMAAKPGMAQEFPDADVISDDSFCKISDTVSPQGILAVVRQREHAMDSLLSGDKALFLEGIQDPGNVGTILRTARSEEFRTDEGKKKAAAICRKHKFDAVVVIGGDGSYRGARSLSMEGIPVMGLPGTIDLDIACTDYTIGFDTAVNTALQAIDKVRDTSSSHERCSIIEVMGRNAGYIALWCGVASGAEDILIPENYNFDEQEIINHIIESRKAGKTHHLIINAEGIGHSTSMARRIEAATGMETRATILGYMQRGGSPTCKDRYYASMMGAMAADLLAKGVVNRVISYKNGEFTDFDIDEALAMKKEISAYQFEIAKALSK